MNETESMFKFLMIFEDVVNEIATETENDHVCEDVRRRVIEKVLNEMKKSDLKGSAKRLLRTTLNQWKDYSK